jgi:3-dehydroquinate dehydratase/shikimate dehydrogenase
MICISIMQESRRFALADMLNAAKQCDLLEVRLDRFQKAPDVGELMTAKPKPVILSCRRPCDGGLFDGTEQERLALLRQCIISRADYVEIELDVADQIRKYPPSKRVISYTNFHETPADIADIYAQAQSKSPDVIKLVTLARTAEQAWPLIQILAHPAVPTVVVGLGRAGAMLTVLGKKIGAPWTYAALERGMEAYPGEPTIADLRTVYHYDSITRATPFLGVTGVSDLERVTVALVNAAMQHLGRPDRCLPLQVGSMNLFRKVIKAVGLGSVFVDEPHWGPVVEIVSKLQPGAEQVGAADLIVHQQDAWFGHNLIGRAAVGALEETLGAASREDRPLEGKPVVIVGTNTAARAIAFRVQRRGGAPVIASRERKAALELAKAVDGRHIQFEALYSIMHDVLIVCADERPQVTGKPAPEEPVIHPSHLQPHRTVLDLTAMPRKSSVLREAEARGCRVVSPRQVLLSHLLLQLRAVTGQDVPREPLAEVLDGLLADED